MASSSASDASPDSYASPPSKGFFGAISTAYNRFSSWRSGLDFPQPGNVENLTKEIKSTSGFVFLPFTCFNVFLATHLTNYMFDGARADLTKSLSMNPLFQVMHSFALGSQTQPSSYNFGAVFANTKVGISKYISSVK